MSVEAAYADYQAGKLDAAESKLAAELMRNPGHSGALHLGAMVASRRGDLRTALNRVRASLRDPLHGHEKLNTQGNILSGLGSLVDAETSFRAALNVQPGYTVGRFNLARLLLQTAQPIEAAQQFSRLLESEPNHDGARQGRLIALIESGQLDEAERLLSRTPLPEARAEMYRARLSFYKGEFEAALGSASKAVADSSNGASPLSLGLQVLHMTGGWDMAEGLITQTLERYPDRPELWGAAITALHKGGQSDAARAFFARAPRAPETLVAQAEIEHDASDFKAAMALCEDALGQRRAWPPAMHHYCRSALGAGEYDRAQQIADIGLRNSPLDQFYYAVKASAGRAKGQDYGYFFNYDKFVKPYDLKAPEGWKNMSAFNADLKAELERLHGFSAAPLDQTLRLGTQTAPDLRFVDSGPIRAFFEAVDPAIRSYMEEIGRDPKHAFLRRNIGGYRIRSAWSVRLGSGGHHVNHMHPEGWISSAYYVDVPKGKGKEGWIKFGEPPVPLNAAMGQGPEHEVEPKAGRLVLFPSYLWHGTYPIADGKSRLTLPIDILPAAP
jgi:tetratricopeptide (TPR) repeat protein